MGPCVPGSGRLSACRPPHRTLERCRPLLVLTAVSFLCARTGTFEGIFTTASEPRTDCPLTLPTPRPIGNRKTPTGQGTWPRSRTRPPTILTRAVVHPSPSLVTPHTEPLTHLQEELVQIFAAVNGITDKKTDGMTSEDGANFLRKMTNRFFGRNMFPVDEWDPSWDWNAD